MRALSRWEIVGVVTLVVVSFAFGMYVGNHRAEQYQYLMFSKLGVAAREGNPSAIKACDGLKDLRAELDTTSTSAHIYWVLRMYNQRP
jgi:hypothetical protein